MTDFIATPETLDIALQIVSPEVLLNVGVNAPVLKAVGPDEAAFVECEFLIKIHPEIYKEQTLTQEMQPADALRYRLFLRSIDAVMCEFRVLLRDLFLLYQPFEAPYPVLPFLSPIVGVDFNFDVPEEFARREIANAIFLWKRKGTRDNIRDWVSFITGFRTNIREYQHEVLRTNVYNQAYAVTPSTIKNRGGPVYNTVPHATQTHTTNTWNGNGIILPFFNFNQPPNSNYGTHGFTQTPGVKKGFFVFDRHSDGWHPDDFEPQEGTVEQIEEFQDCGILPGFLFKNHVGVFLDVPDDAIERTWFGQPFLNLIIDKLERILDLICLFGVVKHLTWRLVTTEDSIYCNSLSFQVIARHSEGWNDTEVLPATTTQTQPINCDNVLEDCISCMVDLYGLVSHGDLCNGEGRLATFVLCTNDPERITNDHLQDSNGGPWLTWHFANYWSEWLGDTLETWSPVVGGLLLSSVTIPPEFTSGELFIGPLIGTGTGQGFETLETIPQSMIDACADGRFEDNILNFVDEWDDPFVDTPILVDNWDIPDIFNDVPIFSDDWELPGLVDAEIFTDDWEITTVFNEATIFVDIWDDFTVFVDNVIHLDDWEEVVPLTIPGPGMWLDGNIGPTGNSPITFWFDRYDNPGTNDAEQQTPAARPDHTPVNPIYNNFGTVQFDGINDYMSVSDDPSLNNNQFTVYAVFDWDIPTLNQTIVSKSTDDTFTDGWGLIHAGGNALRFYVDDINTNFIDFTVPNDTPTIVCARYDQTKLELVVNGQLAVVLYGAGVLNSAKDLIIGGHNTATSVAGFLAGTIAEVIYYDRALDSVEKLTVLQYLSDKYAITIDTATIVVDEEWEFATTFSDTSEVTEPFEFTTTYSSTSEASDGFEVTQAYVGSVEVDEPWDFLGAPTTPVLLDFEDYEPVFPTTPTLLDSEDYEGPVIEVDEEWEPVTFSSTTEVTEPFDFTTTYSSTTEVSEFFEFTQSYSETPHVSDESWDS